MIITLDNKKIEIEKQEKVIDILIKNNINTREYISCKVNNEVKSLNYEVVGDEIIELIDRKNAEGRNTYIRGLLYIMTMAFEELYPHAWLNVNYQLTNAMYCEVDNFEITKEHLENIKNRMQEIINENLPIREVILSKEEAEELYKNDRNIRGKMQLDTKYRDTISLYYCKDFYHYFYGIMPISTGFSEEFDLEIHDFRICFKIPK